MKLVSQAVDPLQGIEQIIYFINNSNPIQIRMDSKRFRRVCIKFVNYCQETGQTLKAINPLNLQLLR